MKRDARRAPAKPANRVGFLPPRGSAATAGEVASQRWRDLILRVWHVDSMPDHENVLAD